MKEKYFKGIFFMFAVISVVLGLLIAFSVTGFSVFNFLNSQKDTPNSQTVLSNLDENEQNISDCALIAWDNKNSSGESPEHFCERKGYSQYVFAVGKTKTIFYDSVDKSCTGRIQSISESSKIGRYAGNFLGRTSVICETTANPADSYVEPYYGDINHIDNFGLKAAQVYCCKS